MKEWGVCSGCFKSSVDVHLFVNKGPLNCLHEGLLLVSLIISYACDKNIAVYNGMSKTRCLL